MSVDQAYAELVNIFGHKNVLREKEEIQQYCLDIYSRTEQKPALVVKPESTKQLSRLFSVAERYELHITPRGSGFDPAMGSMSNNGIIVDLTRLNQVLAVDEEKHNATVQSGINFKSLSTVLASKGFSLGIEPVASSEATIGGFIATHGVGYGSIEHGSILNIVRDLEIVLSDGSIVQTGLKDVPSYATGYDLTRLLIGSEGTLGVITETTLSIFPKPERATNIAFTFSDIKVGADISKEISRNTSTLSSAFIMDGSLMETLQTGSMKVSHEGFLGVLRLEGTKEVVDLEASFTKKVCGSPLHPEVGNRIWNSRFLYPLVKARETPVLVDDYILPTDKNTYAYHKLEDITAKYGLKSSFYSLQISMDSNLSVFIFYTDGSSEAHIAREELESSILSLSGKPCSAGLRRKAAMKKASPGSLDLLKKIQGVFDRENLLNPEKLVL